MEEEGGLILVGEQVQPVMISQHLFSLWLQEFAIARLGGPRVLAWP